MPVQSSMLDTSQRPAGRPVAETAPVEELLPKSTPTTTAKSDELPRITESSPVVVKPVAPAESVEVPSTGGGLAGVLARSKTAKQEVDNITQPTSSIKPT